MLERKDKFMKHINRWAGRYWLCALPILLLGWCDFVARLHDGLKAGEIGIMLRLGYMLEYNLVSVAVACGMGLLINYLEYKYADEQ